MRNNNIGSIIKSARIAKGLSQFNLSRLSSVSESQIIKIEHGEVIPRLSTLKLICPHLSLNIDEDFKKTNAEAIDFGTILKNARISKGYTQVDLAKLCKRTPTAISLFENNKSTPTISTLELLCPPLELDLNEILENIEKRKTFSITYLE